MEKTKIEVDGKIIEIVIKLPKELKDDYVIEVDLEKTVSIVKELNINNE